MLESTTTPRFIARRALIVFVLLIAACGSDSGSTTSPTTTSNVFQTEIFSGTLNVKGSSLYYPPGFTVVHQDTVSVTLVSLTSGPRTQALSLPVAIGIGTPNAAGGCDLTNRIVTTPALVSQISTPLAPNTYCAEIDDVGNLTSPVAFAVRIVHP